MFYKHWKKLFFALTGFFWSSCTFESAAQPLYGVETPNESSSSETALSSLSEALSSSEAILSSSSVEESSSSELMQIIPDYGVYYNPDSQDTIFTYDRLCFNDSAENVEGRVFKIINCIDGNKYLRNPHDAGFEGVELPEGVQVFAPKAGSEQAPNCTSTQDICIERDPSKPIEQDSLAGCHPIIDCPEKPSNITYEIVPKEKTRP